MTVRISLIFLLLMAFGFALHAQTLSGDDLRNVRVDELSDDAIRDYYSRAKATGLTNDQLFALATQRGLPPDQLQLLKERLALLGMGSETENQSKEGTKTASKGVDKPLSQEAAKPELQRIKRDSSIFGSELFSEISNVFEPNFKIATPATYVIGPGDELVVSVYGYSEQTYNLMVNAEGFVFIPNVGPIPVSGQTIEDASLRIRSKLSSTIYKAIKTGQTRIQVSLGKIKSISVTVIGQATKPGTYTVSSLTTLFNILYLCGGPSSSGSFRKVEVIRGNKVVRTADLYSFLLRGDRQDNILLQDQDLIRIPYYTARVAMEGEIRRPARYELVENENLDQLLTYCGGFADAAYRSSIKVIRITDTGRILADIPVAEFASFQPKSGDTYRVASALTKFNNRVTIRGAVFLPGDYELKPKMTLRNLIELAGGLKPDAYQNQGHIARYKQDLTPQSLSFVLKDVMEGKSDLPLQKEDMVTISSLFDLRDQQFVDIEGAVRNGGRFQYRENLTVRDVILMAGGFQESADQKSIEISRRLNEAEVSQDVYQQSEIIRLNLSEGLDSKSAYEILKPFDLLLIRQRGSYEVQRSVTVTGEVISPGRYALQDSRETISSLMKRTGGFKGSADSSAISIRRVARYGLSEEERQLIIERVLQTSRDSILANPELRTMYLNNVDYFSINVEKIKSDIGGPEDLILENGDFIEVARNSNLIRVSGEVFRGGLLPYSEGTTAKYYIKRSGNFTTNARKAKTFVIYPDGRAVSAKRFLLFKSYPKISPRSEVFIPSKLKEGRRGLTTAEWIAISSIAATIATMVVTVVNATK